MPKFSYGVINFFSMHLISLFCNINILVLRDVILNKISSLFLMCTLVLGITPKIFLHNIAANHLDTSLSKKKCSATTISKATFNCNVENSVAHSPYIYFIAAACFTPILNGIEPTAIYKKSFFSRCHFYCELRGPPFC